MKDIRSDLYNLTEKLIKLRIDDIIEKGNIDNDTSIKIKNINNEISKDIKKNKKIKNKKVIPVDDKKLTIYTVFIKDSFNIINNKLTLNYLPNDIETKIKLYKDKKPSEQMKSLSEIWKTIGNDVKMKYKTLTKDKNFTNSKYNEKVVSQSNKTVRKKRSKESLK
jgi:hypothetical protein